MKLYGEFNFLLILRRGRLIVIKNQEINCSFFIKGLYYVKCETGKFL